MPWLLLEMQLTEGTEEIPIRRNNYEIRANKSAMMKLTAIDTDKGKVTEVEYEISSGKLTERAPSIVEARTAAKVLGKDRQTPPDRNRSKLEAQLRNNKALLMTANRENERLKREIARLKQELLFDQPKERDENSFSTADKDMLEAALFGYINTLRENVQLETYSDAKELYRRLTGEDYEPFLESDID